MKRKKKHSKLQNYQNGSLGEVHPMGGEDQTAFSHEVRQTRVHNNDGDQTGWGTSSYAGQRGNTTSTSAYLRVSFHFSQDWA